MAPPGAAEPLSPKGDNGGFASQQRLSASSSAPALLGRKGVQIWIDPDKSPRDVLAEETMYIPNVSLLSVDSQTQASTKPAWSSPGSPSRPGSRGTKYSSRSSSSSVSRGTTGRFTSDEALCFRRVPTPTSAVHQKREQYWQIGGSGELRKSLSESNWHLLPVLKGKFYQHPKLCNTPNRRSTERARAQRLHKKREQLHNSNRVDTLPDENLTAFVLEEIFPKTPTSRPGTSGSVGAGLDAEESVETGSPTSHKIQNLLEARNKMLKNPIVKRLSATEFKSQPGIQEVHSMSAPDLNVSTSGPLGGTVNSQNAALAGTLSKAAMVQAVGQAIMLEFRKQLLEKYFTVKQGFDAFSAEVPANREMTKKEWRRVLSKLGFVATIEERDAIFELLDINHNGHVSMAEFHIAIEAAAPVRTMEDLRRRWLASNYSSMVQAINIMDQNGADSNRRLSLKEFGEALCRVHVADHQEHICIFNAIADMTQARSQVSIGELASAIATVSPAMFIEDIRHRLYKRYGGHVERAFWDLDPDHSGAVTLHEFVVASRMKLGLSTEEAHKVFRGIDVDGGGEITKSEFLCALCMAEPSIFYEDLRTKVRQRYRSIQACFAKAMEDWNQLDLHQNPKLNFPRFQELLHDLEFSEVDLRTLYELIDANGDGALTIKEFNHGVFHFAPSCVLEDLRVQCLMRHDTVAEVFVPGPGRNLPDRGQPLDLEAFEKLLESFNLNSGVDIEAVFYLLDVRNEGYVSLGKLIAALQAGGPGNIQRLPPEERDQKAAQDVKTCLLPHHKLATDLKALVRQSPKSPEEPHGVKRHAGNEDADEEEKGIIEKMAFKGLGAGVKKDSSGIAVACRAAWEQATPPSSASRKGKSDGSGSEERRNSKDGGEHPTDADGHPTSTIAPRLRAPPQEELAKYMAKLDPSRIQEHKRFAQDPVDGAQKSWGKLWDYLKKAPGQKDRVYIEKNLLSYFTMTTKSMSHDMPLLERSHSRHAIHKSVRAHTRALAQNRGR
mmetsp:Transcript_75595/g.130869  ORF Transcript_75595/g.130869 Transcript_75595/m.130869 type:complete len:1006 (-) Transcript_75595:39-3056(-)